MKKNNLIYIMFVFSAVICFVNNSYSQATSAGLGNSPSGAGEYLGWTSGTNATLLVKNEDNQRINFLTNTGAGGTTPVRMTILGGGNVGVNETSPSAKFQVKAGSTSNSNICFMVTDGSGNDFLTARDGGAILMGNGLGNTASGLGLGVNFSTSLNSRLEIHGAGGGNGRCIEVDNTAGSTPIFYVLDNASVGIGVNNPSATLEVKSNSTSNSDLGLMVTDGSGNDVLQTRNGGTVLMGNGLGSTAGCLGIGTNFGTSLNSRLEIHGAGGAYGRCIEVDNASASGGIFYVLDNTRVGIGTSPSHTLELYNDNAAKTTTSTWTTTSDMRLKTDTSLFTDGLDVVRQVHPVYYKYKGVTGLDSVTTNIGIIAQEIQQIAPYVIRQAWMKLDTNDVDTTEVLGVNMHAFWFILINAMKELDANNQALMTRIEQLESQVSGMNGSKQSNPDHNSKTSIDVELNNSRAIILDQNVPNPFADQTTISYTIPDDVSKAQIIFYNNNGSVLRIVDVNEKGKGELNVFAPDLSSGIYTYTLIADGKVIETKKMVKQ